MTNKKSSTQGGQWGRAPPSYDDQEGSDHEEWLDCPEKAKGMATGAGHLSDPQGHTKRPHDDEDEQGGSDKLSISQRDAKSIDEATKELQQDKGGDRSAAAAGSAGTPAGPIQVVVRLGKHTSAKKQTWITEVSGLSGDKLKLDGYLKKWRRALGTGGEIDDSDGKFKIVLNGGDDRFVQYLKKELGGGVEVRAGCYEPNPPKPQHRRSEKGQHKQEVKQLKAVTSEGTAIAKGKG